MAQQDESKATFQVASSDFPSDDLPPPREVEAAQDRIAKAIKLLIAAALAQQFASAGIPQAPNPDVLRRSSEAAAAVVRAIRQLYRIDLSSFNGGRYEDELAQKVAVTAMQWSDDHARSRAFRPPPLNKRREWEQAAANSLATRSLSDALMGVADALKQSEAQFKRKMPKLKKVWVSRADSRVRHSHAVLHGKARQVGTPFKKWSTGQSLKYPGDDSAPLSEIINCRCHLWLTFGTADEIEKKFPPLPVAAAANNKLDGLEVETASIETLSDLSPFSGEVLVFYVEQLERRLLRQAMK